MTTKNDIITRCPQCSTAFRVSEEMLRVANGTVRCGSCLGVFKATEHLTSTSLSNTSDTSDQKTPTDQKPQIKKAESSQLKESEQHSVKKDASQTEKPNIKEKLTQKLSRFIHTDDDEMLIQDGDDDDDDLLIHDDLPLDDNDLTEEKPQKNLLVNDDDEDNEIITSFSFDNNTFDLSSDTSKTNIFDDDENSRNTREKADESWAVDLLADIDDDDIQPIIKKKPAQKEADKETDTTEADPNKYEDNKYDHYDLSDDSLTSDDLNQELAEDEIGNWSNTQPLEDQDSTPNYQEDTLEEIELSSHTNISDEEIENAMHLKTSYASDEASLLESIPDPDSFEWNEPSIKHRSLWILGIITMGLLLALQVAWLRFDTLGKHPSYRPYYAKACNIIGCELPQLSDITKIRATNLIVRSHPDVSNALIVDAILINRAKFEQNYPAIRLEFSDVSDNPISVRNFKPNEYLHGELIGTSIMASNQPIQLSLALVDPGEKAVNYRITVISADTPN